MATGNALSGRWQSAINFSSATHQTVIAANANLRYSVEWIIISTDTALNISVGDTDSDTALITPFYMSANSTVAVPIPQKGVFTQTNKGIFVKASATGNVSVSAGGLALAA